MTVTEHDLPGAEAPSRPPAPPAPTGALSRRGTLVAIAVGALLLLALGLVVGARRDPPAEWAGAVLDTPQDKPAIVLPDTDGNPYDLRAETEGRVTLLFFGYTNCPDICPAHLLNIASALDELPNDVAGQVDLVFVTTDPARDTPDHLRTYLDGFNRRFVGLVGTPQQVAEAEAQAGVAAAIVEPAEDDGSYEVGHAAQVIAYGPDGVAHVVYPFGIRQSDWVHDLPLLAAGETP